MMIIDMLGKKDLLYLGACLIAGNKNVYPTDLNDQRRCIEAAKSIYDQVFNNEEMIFD